MVLKYSKRKKIASFGMICLFLLISSVQLHATSITSYFTFENDGTLTNSPFGSLVIDSYATDMLRFVITADKGKLGPNADIEEFGFMIDFAHDLVFTPSPPVTGSYGDTKITGGRNSIFDWVVRFGTGNTILNPVTFYATASGLTIDALTTAGFSSQNDKPNAQFIMHVQSTDTTINTTSEAVGGIYGPLVSGGPDVPVPEPATMLLFGTGLVGLAGLARRRNKK